MDKRGLLDHRRLTRPDPRPWDALMGLRKWSLCPFEPQSGPVLSLRRPGRPDPRPWDAWMGLRKWSLCPAEPQSGPVLSLRRPERPDPRHWEAWMSLWKWSLCPFEPESGPVLNGYGCERSVGWLVGCWLIGFTVYTVRNWAVQQSTIEAESPETELRSHY